MRYVSGTLVVVLGLGLGLSSKLAAQQRDPAQAVQTVDDVRHDDRGWGWLGLVGLAGLAGLRRRDSHDRSIVRTDPHPSSARP